MRRSVGILSMAIVPVFVAGMAFAADPYSEKGTHHTGSGATAGATGFMGEHTMTGRITSIDKDKGRVKIEAQGEELDLHFPQSALKNLNKGDQVQVSLGIKPMTGTSGTRGTSGTSGPPGMPGGRGTDLPGSIDR